MILQKLRSNHAEIIEVVSLKTVDIPSNKYIIKSERYHLKENSYYEEDSHKLYVRYYIYVHVMKLNELEYKKL
jgi:hypothetical protein